MAATKTRSTAKAEDAKDEETTFSAKDLANELKIDAKAFRRWLRAHTEDRANKGGRWIFTEKAKDDILAAYNAKDKATDAKLKA